MSNLISRSGLVRPLLARGSLALAVSLALAATVAEAAETILFNESPAYMCYLAAIDQRAAEEGLDDCDIAIEKQGLGTATLAATLSNRGLLHARAGAVDDAIKDHDRAVRLNPEVGSLFINRANAYTLQERFLPALQDLDFAVQIGDEQVHLAYYNRALIHQRLGNLAAARQDAEQALATVPDSDRYTSLVETLAAESKAGTADAPAMPTGLAEPQPRSP